ncbi:MAG: metallophosphoesterase family protein [Ferruginibacter sp.]
MKIFSLATIALSFSATAFSQNNQPAIPAVLHGIAYNNNGKLMLTGLDNVEELERKDLYVLSKMIGNPSGTETGISIDINMPGFTGTVAYGPLDENAADPTIAFLPKDVNMIDGKALLEIKKVFTKANDFFKLEEKGKGIIGYRIINQQGRIIYEGRVAFEGKSPYTIVPTIIEGPMINNLSADSCVITYETQMPVKTFISVDNKTYEDPAVALHHEITINGLKPSTKYIYTVQYNNRTSTHYFTTAPAAGSHLPFSFAFASANRSTTGGGERDFGGTNYQATRIIMAAAAMNNAAFMQVQGDFTNGGNTTTDAHDMEYANFKRALEPFWFKTPVYTGFGDHEPNKKVFAPDVVSKKSKSIEMFPYATASGEAGFAKAFVNPPNGPVSEDGASYDPNAAALDFPTYKENVYYYTYGNVAMIVLNTEYWESKDPSITSGCPEGYIMDQQVKWLKETMQKMEANKMIDHIFVVVHGAVFPNGDHLADAMWWKGENKNRAVVAGVPLAKGTIERRDEILDICVNKSNKFIGFISGDEHNFSCLEITPQSSVYTENYEGKKIKLSRSFYNINNGGGGSAPYAMLPSPWSKDFKYFTAPPVLAMIQVNGKSVTLNAMRTETFEKICENIQLR